MFNSGAGLVIIIGCSHAGICSITEYGREVCRESRVIDMTGGLHLLTHWLSRLSKAGKYLQKLQLQAINPCHCTSLPSKIALAEHCSIKNVGTGMKTNVSVSGIIKTTHKDLQKFYRFGKQYTFRGR